MIISMITMIGNSVYSATSTDDLPAAIMMLMTSIYFFYHSQSYLFASS